MTLASTSPLSHRPRRRTPARPRPSVERADGWWLATLPAATPEAALPRDLGKPGLWRTLVDARGQARSVFELPHAALGEHEDDCLAWARATRPRPDPKVAARPRRARNAEPPGDAELSEWLPASMRRVRVGAHARKVEVAAAPSRLALVVPDLARASDALCETRSAWLAAACREAQNRWRLVRFGVRDGRASIEVDLTGAPRSVAPRLFPIALAAVTAAADWTLPGLAAITDTTLVSELLEASPPLPCADRVRRTHPAVPRVTQGA